MTVVRVEGLRKLRRELKEVSADLPKELSKVGRDAAGIVAATAQQIAPRRSGRLAAAVKPGVTVGGAHVKVSNVVYAKPIHFGWRRHNIAPNPFLYDALDQRRDEVIERYRDGVAQVLARDITRGTGE